MTGVYFLSKMVYERVSGPRGRASMYDTDTVG